MIRHLRRVAERAADAVAERALDAAGFDVDASGVLVLRVDGRGAPGTSPRALARVIVALEGADVRSPSWLTLATLEPGPWPAMSPRALVLVEAPDAAWLEPLAELADEFGWAPIVALDPGQASQAAAWVGAGCVVGARNGGDDVEAWRRHRDALLAACGVAPVHALVVAGGEEARVSRAAREAGLGVVFGHQRGLACARLALGAQPTVAAEGLRPADAVGWALRDRARIAAAEARRAVLTLR